MRICIFSDVHGNIEALDKLMLREVHNTDYFVFAGDIFGYFYGQREIINKLISIKKLLAVKGNHERYYLEKENNKEYVENYGSSYCILLSKSERKFVEELPEFLEMELGGKRIGIFHGGTEDYLEQRIYPDTKIKYKNLKNKYEYLILGHTHYRFAYRKDGLTVINPGSLGQPRDGAGFSYCILDTDTGGYEFLTVEVDMKKLLAEVYKRDGEKTVYKYLGEKYGDS